MPIGHLTITQVLSNLVLHPDKLRNLFFDFSITTGSLQPPARTSPKLKIPTLRMKNAEKDKRILFFISFEHLKLNI